MKKILCLAICFISLVVSHAYATSHLSTCTFGKQTLNEVVCYGPAKLIQTTVSGNAVIAGPLEAQHTVLASMQVIGLTNLRNSDVKANVRISGDLTAKNGQFDGNVDVTSEKILLNNSTIKGSLTINSEKEEPQLTLICGTQIRGKVVFSNHSGVINKTKDSIIEGKVVNGRVVQIVSKEKCPPSAASLAILPSYCSIRYLNDVVGGMVKKCSRNISVAGKKMKSYS